jgi:hypothetical protein
MENVMKPIVLAGIMLVFTSPLAAIALTLALTTITKAADFAEVLDGSAQLNRSGSISDIGRGARLYEGDRLTVPSRLQLILPYGAATVTKRQGTLKFLLLRREGCGIRVHIVYSGGIGANARPRTCIESSITFESVTSGAFFNPWVNTNRGGSLTPNTRIAQLLETTTGASFSLADRNDTSILAVASGAVEAQSQNVVVPIFGNQGNITKKGQPPEPAIALDNNLSITTRPIKSPLGFRLNASLNPLNFLFYQGAEILPAQEIEWPILGNSINVEVKSADGQRSRPYVFPLPSRR